jgi:hypothetical protein
MIAMCSGMSLSRLPETKSDKFVNVLLNPKDHSDVDPPISQVRPTNPPFLVIYQDLLVLCEPEFGILQLHAGQVPDPATTPVLFPFMQLRAFSSMIRQYGSISCFDCFCCV